MDANEPFYVVCHNGVFLLPDGIVRSLATLVKHGFVYLRQDADSLTISTCRIADGQRRQLNSRIRVPMFRKATRLAIVNLYETVQIMAVNASR
jgi:hypothetical protein